MSPLDRSRTARARAAVHVVSGSRSVLWQPSRRTAQEMPRVTLGRARMAGKRPSSSISAQSASSSSARNSAISREAALLPRAARLARRRPRSSVLSSATDGSLIATWTDRRHASAMRRSLASVALAIRERSARSTRRRMAERSPGDARAIAAGPGDRVETVQRLPPLHDDTKISVDDGRTGIDRQPTHLASRGGGRALAHQGKRRRPLCPVPKAPAISTSQVVGFALAAKKRRGSSARALGSSVPEAPSRSVAYEGDLSSGR